LGRWNPQVLFQAIEGAQDLVVSFDQGSAGLAEAAMVLGEAAHAGGVMGADRTQAGLAGLAPGEKGGRVERALGGSAMAGGLAAAGAEFVEGAFEELAQGEQIVEALLVIGEQSFESLAETAGVIG